MGCCCSSDNTHRVMLIDSYLKNVPTTRSIALCGTTGAGKSTIFHQIEMSQGNWYGYNLELETRLDDFLTMLFPHMIRCTVQLCKIVIQTDNSHFIQLKKQMIGGSGYNDINNDRNAHDSFRVVLRFYLSHCTYAYYSGSDENINNVIQAIENGKFNVDYVGIACEVEVITQDIKDAIKYLWNCNVIQYAYKHYHHLYQMMEHLEYFMDKFDMFFMDNHNNDLNWKQITRNDILKLYWDTGRRFLSLDIDSPFKSKRFTRKYVEMEKCTFSIDDCICCCNCNNDPDSNILLDEFKRKASIDTTCLLDRGWKSGNEKRFIHNLINCEAILYVVALDDYCKHLYVLTFLTVEC